ncbi:MAG: diguanylate cyclase [Erysipelotrichaceae bacterium]|nr:diguanylate cyclase [Erysipelotrichaceae bacterium]
MRLIYYVQTNVISIVVTALILLFLLSNRAKRDAASEIMIYEMFFIMGLCISDIMAAFLEGQVFPGSLTLIHIANIMYYLFPIFISQSWYLYIRLRLKLVKDVKKEMLYSSIPSLIIGVLLITNIFTGFFYSIDANGVYSRGPGMLVHWFTCWLYFIVALIINYKAYKNEPSDLKKREYRNYLLFIIPIAVASIIQVLVFGVTTAQLGFVFVAVIVLATQQQSLIHHDELTGLNNRNSLMSYADSISNNPRNDILTVVMIDVDHFKSINDRFGHLVGDEALQHTSKILKRAAGAIENPRLHIYRYGGDEFVIIGVNAKKEIFDKLMDNLKKETENENSIIEHDYEIEMSIGVASGTCNSVHDLYTIMDNADKNMYLQKTSKKH